MISNVPYVYVFSMKMYHKMFLFWPWKQQPHYRVNGKTADSLLFTVQWQAIMHFEFALFVILFPLRVSLIRCIPYLVILKFWTLSEIKNSSCFFLLFFLFFNVCVFDVSLFFSTLWLHFILTLTPTLRIQHFVLVKKEQPPVETAWMWK